MSDIFISYARSTADHARRIAEALGALGYRVWRDDELPAHRSYAEVIEERLTEAKAVVVVWSAEAVKSEWVRSEANRAREDHKLVQLSVDGVRLPMPFDQIQCADLSGWMGEAEAPSWKKVVGSIADLAGATGRSGLKSSHDPKRVGVCVLPFANMSGEAEQEYFSDGISEDIITDLSKVSALAVVSRNTAFTFKGKSIGVADLARQLGVTHVLEGSVRKAGNRVRITAQLIEGVSDSHVWAERYDRDLTDIFALQDEISQAIVAALKLKLLPGERKAIENRGTSNAEAYNLYLMARRQYVTGNVGDTRREEAIIRLCGRAVEIDPGYARAWALISTAQASLRYNRGKATDDGLAAADKALRLDPALAEPHAVRARVLHDLGQATEALAEIETALRLDPESSEVTRAAGLIYYRQKQLDDAIRCFAKAAELNESDFGSAGMLINMHLARGDRESARRAARTTLERSEKVVAEDPNNGHAMAFGVSALAVLGEKERAKEWMGRALLVDPDNMLVRYNFACMLILEFADPDGAIEMLRPVFATISIGLLNHAKVDVDLEALRRDPRFQGMMAEADARLAATAPNV